MNDTEKQFQALLLNEDCNGIRELFGDRQLTDREQIIFINYLAEASAGTIKLKNPGWVLQCNWFTLDYKKNYNFFWIRSLINKYYLQSKINFVFS